jgi:hypothetical protein
MELGDGLVHLYALALGAHAEEAKRARNWKTYSGCIKLVDKLWPDAEPGLQNALAVSFLEHLQFDGAQGSDAWRLLTPRLQREWQRVMAHWKKLKEITGPKAKVRKKRPTIRRKGKRRGGRADA